MTPPITKEELSWIESRKCIEYQLSRLNDSMEKIDEKLEIISRDMAVVKTKVMAISAIAAIVVTAIVQLMTKYL